MGIRKGGKGGWVGLVGMAGRWWRGVPDRQGLSYHHPSPGNSGRNARHKGRRHGVLLFFSRFALLLRSDTALTSYFFLPLVWPGLAQGVVFI